MLNKRWQLGNLHLLPSADVFSSFVMYTPFAGILHTGAWRTDNSEPSRTGYFYFQYITDLPKPFIHSAEGRRKESIWKLDFQDRLDIILKKRPSGVAELRYTILYGKSQVKQYYFGELD